VAWRARSQWQGCSQVCLDVVTWWVSPPSSTEDSFSFVKVYKCLCAHHYPVIYRGLIVLFAAAVKYCMICFKETEGSRECEGERDTCSGWASPGMDDDDVEWSEPFRDNTDGRPGGCKYQWRLICENKIQESTSATTSPGRAMQKVAAIAAAAEDMDASKSNDTAAGTTAAPSGNGGLQQQIDAINEELKYGKNLLFCATPVEAKTLAE